MNFSVTFFHTFFTEFDCPSVGPLGVCSNQGTCDDSTGTCICDEGFEGNVCLGNLPHFLISHKKFTEWQTFF